MKRLVIVVPIYKKDLNPFELKSLDQLFKICGHYDIVYIHPEGLELTTYQKISPSSVQYYSFPAKFFRSLESYSDLMISWSFYKRFDGYEFMLIYQPDAFIFKDDLGEWMDKGYDYIGAPFFFYYTTIREKAAYGGVGNGGFSLRKISSLKRILSSWKPYYDRKDINELKAGKNLKGRLFYEAQYWLGKIGLVNNTHHWFNRFNGYEDYFWGVYAGPKFSWMKFPDYHTALKFSFEFNCNKLYADNNQQLPTGCHRWWGDDREFWKPYMKEYGIEL